MDEAQRGEGTRGGTAGAVTCPRLLSLCLVLVLGLVGCSHVSPKPVPEDVRAQLGPVAVIPARFEAKTELRMPAKGGVAGTGRGAATGALKGMSLATELGRGCQGYGCIFSLALIPAGGLIGGLVGAIHGGLTAVPAAAVEDGSAELRSAMAELDLQETLGHRVFRAAQAQTCHRLVIDNENGPRGRKEKIGYQPLVADGIQTVLEISVLGFELKGPWDVNPELELIVSARARLVRTSDGAVLYERTLDHRSIKRRFADWATDGGGPFRVEREGALDHLAGEIVADTLLIENGGAEACRG
jgi:hypothetical protein